MATSKTPPRVAAKDVEPDTVDPVEPDPTDAAPDFDDLQEQINGLHTRLDEAQQRTDETMQQILAAVQQAPPAEPVAEPEPDPTVTALPEGTTRFFSPIASDFNIILKHKTFITTAQGVHEPIPQRVLSFTSHICTTDDEELIELARAYIKKKGDHEFFEDPQAQPVNKVRIAEGSRSTGTVDTAPDALTARQAALVGRL